MRAYNQLTKEQIDTVKKGYFTAKQEGYAGVEPFLQEEMNIDKKACYFFQTHAFASAFFPNKETAEITGFFLPHRMNRYEYEDFLVEKEYDNFDVNGNRKIKYGELRSLIHNGKI